MRSIKPFSVFFLLLCTIGFISCSDDNDTDNPEYHLELSGNTCEVMQGRSAVIDLTAHEHTTLNIEDPNLIDALYTWEIGPFKAKIEIKGKQKGETDIVVTDHETGETATIKVKVTEYPMPRLTVDKAKANIFDMMNFSIYNESSQPINTKELSTVCDSIVWTVDGLNGTFRVYEHVKEEGVVGDRLTFKWGHCFKYPGEYKTYLTAWKDNKEINRHQLDISVTDEKDFLLYNWNEITKDSQAWTGYADVLRSSPDLMTTYGLSGTVPYAEMRLFNSNSLTQTYDVLYGYVCQLYSTPKYDDKKDNMWKLYDELFSEQKRSGYPVAIWTTEQANIILLLLDDGMDYPAYVIYAEPRNIQTLKIP